ncbi:hypothetical protein Tco_0281214 [Tanacetum coccineum]
MAIMIGSLDQDKGNNMDVKKGSVGSNDLSVSTSSISLTNEQVMKLMNLLNEKSQSFAHANMTDLKINGVNYHYGWVIDSDANQHMTNTYKNMFDVVNISELNLTMGHPNGTLAKITHVGNLKLNKNVVLFDVLVVTEYCVSLLFVHKLIKDSKLSVSFDEATC